MPKSSSSWFLCGVMLGLFSFANAESVVYPPDAQIIDVTQAPYFADKAGKMDATEAIQKALSDHPAAERVIYLPNGLYLISKPILWPEGTSASSKYRHTQMQGQSEAGTIIKLAPSAAGFQDTAKPQAMIKTSCCVAQAFRNSVRNLTLDAGEKNPGAIALQFFASNQGIAEHLTLTAPPGSGFIGLDMGFDGELGPQTARRITVKGFATGVNAHWGYFVTMEHIHLENQSKVGVSHIGARSVLRGLISKNTVPALINASHGTNTLVLIDAELSGLPGAETKSAIENKSYLHLRNVKVTGYAQTLKAKQDLPVGLVTQWTSKDKYDSLMPHPGMPKPMPIQEMPEPAWDDPKDWANIVTYGADTTGKMDATKAIQAAIDAGKPTVYFPGKFRFLIDSVIEIRGKVKHILGCEGKTKGKGLFKLVDAGPDAPPVVVMQRFANSYDNLLGIEQASKRTLVVRSISDMRIIGNGPGNLFITDWVGRLSLQYPGQNVWARGLNSEYFTIENKGARLWVLGMKTEGTMEVIRTTQGGWTEVLGALNYANKAGTSAPMFSVADANLSLHGVTELSFGNVYKNWVIETRGTRSDTLFRSEVAGGVLDYLGLPVDARLSVEFQKRFGNYHAFKHRDKNLFALPPKLPADGRMRSKRP